MIDYRKTFNNENEKIDFVNECDTGFNSQVKALATLLSKDRSIKFIMLCGPTCSGKTTAARIISNELYKRGISLHAISIDDFFNRVDDTVPDWQNTDMESVDAIDLNCFFECVNSITANSRASVPIFDFKTRKRKGYRDIVLKKNDIIMFEGIQAIYPQITGLIPEDCRRSIYISVKDSVNAYGNIFSPRQIRLSRRITRDVFYRNVTSDIVLDMWNNVERNEKKNIEPYKDSVQLQIDSLLLYEFNVISYYASGFTGNNTEIARLRDVYGNIPQISPNYIPEDSLFREFIRI